MFMVFSHSGNASRLIVVLLKLIVYGQYNLSLCLALNGHVKFSPLEDTDTVDHSC